MISPRYHREIPQRYRLEAGQCNGCQEIHFPPRAVCRKCGEQRPELRPVDDDPDHCHACLLRQT